MQILKAPIKVTLTAIFLSNYAPWHCLPNQLSYYLIKKMQKKFEEKKAGQNIL